MNYTAAELRAWGESELIDLVLKLQKKAERDGYTWISEFTVNGEQQVITELTADQAALVTVMIKHLGA